jgi:glycosyltransferase involved in cell wall biosynthesis
METVSKHENRLNGCVMIPAFNEEKHIGAVIASAAQFLPVLVIDDGSQDKTSAVAEASGAQVYKQIPNQGKGAALQRGFREALQSGYNFLITLDADGQHNPAEIGLFLEKYQQEKCDLIIGYRDFSKMPFIRKVGNGFGGRLFSWAVGKPIKDNQSGYRLLSKALLAQVLDSKEHGFEYEVEIVVRCIQSGYRLGWVPIQTIYADETSHIRPVHHFLHFMRLVLNTRKRMRRH